MKPQDIETIASRAQAALDGALAPKSPARALAYDVLTLAAALTAEQQRYRVALAADDHVLAARVERLRAAVDDELVAIRDEEADDDAEWRARGEGLSHALDIMEGAAGA